MHKSFVLFLLWLLGTLNILSQPVSTRGIGIYPGRQSENMAPKPTIDNTYRNVALFKKAWASSSIDLNHTAQLITDGIVDHSPISWFEVITNTGEVPRYAREWTIDGGRYSEWALTGEEAFIEYRWHNRPFDIDGVHLIGRLAHDENANGDYSIIVSGSSDGKTWLTLGKVEGDTLPGKALKWKLHSDPNKQTDNDLIPARNIDFKVSFHKTAHISHLRITFKMRKAVYWMLWDTEMLRKTDNDEYLPIENINSNNHFQSAWVGNEEVDHTVTVDLSQVCNIDKAVFHWVNPPKEGTLVTSTDGKEWHKQAYFQQKSDTLQTLKFKAQARYVKFNLQQPNTEKPCALSEMEVWGTGGMSFQPSKRSPATYGTISLNGGNWTLQREGCSETIQATVPATVLTSYTNVMAVPDTNTADSLLQVSDTYFNAPFLYETTFDLPSSWLLSGATLNLDGINWKADIWLNGQLLKQVEGAFKRHRVDITPLMKDTDNHLRITVYPPPHPGPTKEKTQLTTGTNGGRLTQDAPTFLASVGWDWISTIRGRNMGIYDNVYLTRNSLAKLSGPLVETIVDADTLATISPRVVVENCTESPQELRLKGNIGPVYFEKLISLPPLGKQEISFSPEEYLQLKRQALPLWWPNDMGNPYLHQASYALYDHDTLIDTLIYAAGLRQITYKDVDSALKIYVNNRRVVPMGGNWGFSEANLNYRTREYDAAVDYHRQQHFNMIRNWVGQTADDRFFEACDRKGILVWQDFWLANPADGPNPANEQLFTDCAEDFVARIRRHPSVVLYCGRNEGNPTDKLDKDLHDMVGTLSPQHLYISDSASGGVSGHGPYKAIPEEEYFEKQTGRLHTERGMPCIPTPEGMLRMFGGQNAWPQNALWGQHDFTEQGAQGGKAYNERLETLFGTPQSMEQYARLAQITNYNGYRAMFESTLIDRQGLLIWMSHPCWPTMVWQTYDYYLEPTAAFFGVKKACEPLHLFYNSLTNEVMLVNRSGKNLEQATCTIKLFGRNGQIFGSEILYADSPDDSTTTLTLAPEPPENCGSYFLLLTLEHPQGTLLTENCYMLSTEGNHHDLMNNHQELPEYTWSIAAQDDEIVSGEVLLTNNTDRPMPFLRIELTDENQQQILPVDYSDNYITLKPHQRKSIRIKFRKEDLHGQSASVRVQNMLGGNH